MKIESLTNFRGVEFRAGDMVRLTDRQATARIQALYAGDMKGGVWLNKPLAGLRAWHVDDLERVAEPAKKAGVE